MSRHVYRMKIIPLIAWNLYVVLIRILISSLVLLIGSFIIIPLNINYMIMFRIWILLAIIYVIAGVSERVIYVAFDDSALILRSLVRTYRIKWNEIKSMDRIVKKPRFIGLSILKGCWKSATREMLKIETVRRVFNVELFLDDYYGFYHVNSFGVFTDRLASDLEMFYNTKTRVTI